MANSRLAKDRRLAGADVDVSVGIDRRGLGEHSAELDWNSQSAQADTAHCGSLLGVDDTGTFADAAAQLDRAA